MTAVFIGVCIICGVLVAIAVDISRIAKVVEKFGVKDGEVNAKAKNGQSIHRHTI